MKEENPKQQEQGTAEPSKPEDKRPVSGRKVRANRENAKKSTGPKTARGKRSSSFNALKHGLLAKKLMFAADGTPLNPDLASLFEALRAEYGCGDVASELLTELVAVDYWRLQKGLEYEMKYLTPKGGEFHPQGGMPTLVRYMTANRHAFEKNLQALMQRKAVALATAIPNDDNPLDATASGETPTPPIPGGNPRPARAVAVAPLSDGEPLKAEDDACLIFRLPLRDAGRCIPSGAGPLGPASPGWCAAANSTISIISCDVLILGMRAPVAPGLKEGHSKG